MKNIEKKIALDCGAGIGRVSKNLLLKNFEHVEMCDATENFLIEAKKYLGPQDSERVLNFHCCRLQNFYPEGQTYDCIWIQWVLDYLQDNDLIEFLKRCKLALKPKGFCVLKENISKNKDELCVADSSCKRSMKKYSEII